MKQVLHFVVVPDSSAARRLRLELATKSPCQGIQVGTWPELIEQANSANLIGAQQSNGRQAFNHVLAHLPDAFRSHSLEVAPEETAAEVESALSLLVSATQPGGELYITLADQLPDRPRKHVQDIVRLIAELDGALPDSLLAISRLVQASPEPAIRLYLGI